MSNLTKPSQVVVIEQACDLEFVEIPAGTYTVGITKENARLANGRAILFHLDCIPLTQVTLPSFWITTDLVRLSHWNQLATSARFAATLKRAVAKTALTDFQCTWVKGKNSSFVEYTKDKIEADPALTLTYKRVQKLARKLKVTLPTWSQWQVAATGPEYRQFPWGDEWDLSTLKLSYLEYSRYWATIRTDLGSQNPIIKQFTVVRM